jgi:hypothetical protein
MDDNSNKLTKRRDKFAGKEDISRQTVDTILAGQIDQLREISQINDDTASKVQESVEILYEKRIPLNTEKFEQLNRHFIAEMENKLLKVKQLSRGLKWYIVMWTITIASAFLVVYFINERKQWKDKAIYWYQMYEEVQEKPKGRSK